MSKVLVLGGTGAMGRYVVPALLELGHSVDVVSLDEKTSDNPHLRYIRGNMKDAGFMDTILSRHYDGIVDYMIYGTEEFRAKYRQLLNGTGHYIFLSSCRVYADDPPLTEKSPRLLDVSEDKEYLATDDYSLFKAREEDILHQSGLKNWTIVRPSTTYSTGRFQLVTLEANTILYRMLAGKTIVLPEAAMDRQATLSWGGDVGKMLALLLFNPKAPGESYNTATAEHHSWREIAAIYNEICPFRYVTVSIDDYLQIHSEGGMGGRYQLMYARMFQRITDNRKVLAHTGMKQEVLMTLRDGLRMEFEHSRNFDWTRCADAPVNLRMDAYLAKMQEAKA